MVKKPAAKKVAKKPAVKKVVKKLAVKKVVKKPAPKKAATKPAAKPSTQHEGHARGVHAPGHISFFKRYDTVGAFAAEHSALPIPDPIPKPLHSALAAAQNRSAGALQRTRTCQPLASGGCPYIAVCVARAWQRH